MREVWPWNLTSLLVLSLFLRHRMAWCLSLMGLSRLIDLCFATITVSALLESFSSYRFAFVTDFQCINQFNAFAHSCSRCLYYHSLLYSFRSVLYFIGHASHAILFLTICLCPIQAPRDGIKVGRISTHSPIDRSLEIGIRRLLRHRLSWQQYRGKVFTLYVFLSRPAEHILKADRVWITLAWIRFDCYSCAKILQGTILRLLLRQYPWYRGA